MQATTETFDTSNYQILSDAAATDFPANYDNFTSKCRGIFKKRFPPFLGFVDVLTTVDLSTEFNYTIASQLCGRFASR